MLIKIAVVGSRTFNNVELLEKTLDEFFDGPKENFLLISGGAKGADFLGEKYAEFKGINTKIFLADWEKYGKSAGYRRNVKIVDESDIVIAFWDGKSKGTKHSIDLANKHNKSVYIYWG